MNDNCDICDKDIVVNRGYRPIIVCRECIDANKKLYCDMCDNVIKEQRVELEYDTVMMFGAKCDEDGCKNIYCKPSEICSSVSLRNECIKCKIGTDLDRFQRIADNILSRSIVKSAMKQ